MKRTVCCLLVLLGVGAHPGHTAESSKGAVLWDYDIREAVDPLIERVAVPSLSGVRKPWQETSYLPVDFHFLTVSRSGAGEVRGLTEAAPDRDRVEIAREFLRENHEIFRLSDLEVEGLRLERESSEASGVRHLHFFQTVDGVPVFGGLLQLVFGADGRLLQVGVADILPGLDLGTRPSLSEAEAVQAALKWTGGPHGKPQARSALVVFPVPGGDSRLAYEVYLHFRGADPYHLVVDAHDGELLFRESPLGGKGDLPVFGQTLAAGPDAGKPFEIKGSCDGTPGQWAGCRGTGCLVCVEKVANYPLYFQNHPGCTPNSTCNGQYFTCNAACPAPTSADQCNGTAGQWSGCRGTGCSVCSELVANYPCYFQNHPLCQRNTICGGLYFTCNANCPAPTAADACETCNGTPGQWAGCRGTGCSVCSEKVANYPCYFENHPECDRNDICGGQYFTCNSKCPAPTAADACACNGTAGQWAGCRGTGCSVCAELVDDYPCYFQNHPDCQRNTICGGQYFTCNAKCPAPTAADACLLSPQRAPNLSVNR